MCAVSMKSHNSFMKENNENAGERVPDDVFGETRPVY
jgi:hypothetical protein